MTDHQPILVGVDGSRASSAAIRFAAREALRLGAPLQVVHVVAGLVPMAPMYPLVPADLEDTGRAILARAVDEARALQPTVPLTKPLIDGPRVRALVQAARARTADRSRARAAPHLRPSADRVHRDRRRGCGGVPRGGRAT